MFTLKKIISVVFCFCGILELPLIATADDTCQPAKYSEGELSFEGTHLVAKTAKGREEIPNYDQIADCVRLEVSKANPDFIEFEYVTVDVGTSVIASTRRMGVIDTKKKAWAVKPFLLADRNYIHDNGYEDRPVGKTEWRGEGKNLSFWFVKNNGKAHQLWPSKRKSSVH